MALFKQIRPKLGATCSHRFHSEMPLVLNGWGFQATVWQSLADTLATAIQVVDQPCNQDYDTWLDQLAGCLEGTRARVIAWSLGVQTAARLQQRGIRFDSVVAIAGRSAFLVTTGRGLKGGDLLKFQKRVAKGGERPKHYFASLVSHGGQMAATLDPVIEQLQPELADFSLSLADLGAQVAPLTGNNVLYVLGDNDALVAPEAETPGAEQVVLDACAHDLPLSATATLAELMEEHWLRCRQRKVARSFSRAVESYGESSDLQQRVADTLLTQVELPSGGLVVDLGSGTGYCAKQLVNRFDGRLVCVDLSPKMVAHTQRLGFESLVADAQDLPFDDNSVDVLVSSLAIQWCPNPQRVFAEISRVLKPNGKAWVATLGEMSLEELRASAVAAGVGDRINRFPSHRSWQQFAQAPALKTTLDCYRTPVSAQNFSELLRHLRGVGANCVLGMPRKALTRSDLARWADEAYSAGGGSYQTHYDIVQLSLNKTH